MRFLKLFSSLLFAVLMVWLAVANRGRVEWALTPLPWRLEMPLFLILFFGLFFGLLAGIFIGWLRGWPTRRALRDAKLRIANLTNELHEVRGYSETPASNG